MIEKEDKNTRKKFFEVEISEGERKGYIYAPSSIDAPHSNTVMFVTAAFVDRWDNLLQVKDCLVFWPEILDVPEKIKNIHFIVPCEKPRLEFDRFFKKNGLKNITLEKQRNIYLERFNDEKIALMNDIYIGEEVTIGDNVYIGSGVRLIGKIIIGNTVIIHENSVLGADGLSMEREEDGTIITIPQFGGIIIEDNVTIGANVVIARGAIGNTVIQKGCVIDNGCFISHNVILEENVAMVGESIIFGSCHIGKNSFISGNVTIRDHRTIGINSFIGMGSVVANNVEKEYTVYGNPAKEKK